MATTRYQPESNLLSPILDDLFARPFARMSGMPGLLRAPEADVVETEQEILVVMDAPGMKVADIDINLENNVLTVAGERSAEWEQDGRQRFHLAERRYGSFSRSFVLPRDVDQEQIAARFEDGVLTIRVPKTEKARRRRIEIQSGDGDGRGARRQIEQK